MVQLIKSSVLDMGFQIENIYMDDESIGLLNYEPLKTYVLSLLLLTSLITGTYIRVLILKYILFHSPRDRPINILVIFEQVKFNVYLLDLYLLM